MINLPDEMDLLEQSEHWSPNPPALKLSAANDGAKLETSRYRSNRAHKLICLSIHLEGEREEEGVLFNTGSEQTD